MNTLGDIRIGDQITIAGLHARNTSRRWWQFWKPKFMKELQVFTVVDHCEAKLPWQ